MKRRDEKGKIKNMKLRRGPEKKKHVKNIKQVLNFLSVSLSTLILMA